MDLAAIKHLPLLILVAGSLTACAHRPSSEADAGKPLIGRYEISTIPVPGDLVVRSATYTPSGEVLVSYAIDGNQDEHQLNLAVMNDDGTNLHTFFSQKVPARQKQTEEHTYELQSPMRTSYAVICSKKTILSD